MATTRPASLSTNQKVVRVALVLIGAIGLFGGGLQMFLGQPETTARLDNVHRFMAGIYLGSAIIALWAAATIRTQGALVSLIALAVLLGGVGRLLSMMLVGIPDPSAVWLAYLVPELVLPVVIFVAHRPGARNAAQASAS
ncbi:MAG: DUF4345 domain-containing protein [Thermaurantiacus sp.]